MRDGRVPPAVDDRVEVRRGARASQAIGPRLHRVEVRAEDVGAIEGTTARTSSGPWP